MGSAYEALPPALAQPRPFDHERRVGGVGALVRGGDAVRAARRPASRPARPPPSPPPRWEDISTHRPLSVWVPRPRVFSRLAAQGRHRLAAPPAQTLRLVASPVAPAGRGLVGSDTCEPRHKEEPSSVQVTVARPSRDLRPATDTPTGFVRTRQKPLLLSEHTSAYVSGDGVDVVVVAAGGQLGRQAILRGPEPRRARPSDRVFQGETRQNGGVPVAAAPSALRKVVREALWVARTPGEVRSF